MKKAILIMGLMAITTISFGQTVKNYDVKNVNTLNVGQPIKDTTKKPEQPKITDISKPKSVVQQVPYLDIRINSFVDAKTLLDALTSGLKSMLESDQISAKEFTHAQYAYRYIADKIYERWPDLIPKQ